MVHYYVTSLRCATEQMALYAKRVLDGCKPGNLPVQSVPQHQLVH
jgi:hypothetical protein